MPLLFSLFICFSGDVAPVSGQLVDGYRVLNFKDATGDMNLTVFRGDYIKFDHGKGASELAIPDLDIQKEIPGGKVSDLPYFKMKKAGEFSYQLGQTKGIIKVLEFSGKGYREMDTEQSQAYLESAHPVILDVRTRGEYLRAHIKGAILIPVQELQMRLSELEKYKNQDILVYCATGNRSTVSSKILIDNGFQSIVNMRYGMADWLKQGKPAERSTP